MAEPVEYHIETVADLLKIPPDRLEAFFRDLREGLLTVHAVKDVAVVAAEIQGMPDPDKAVTFTHFTWKDDGKPLNTVSISMKEGSAPSQSKDV